MLQSMHMFVGGQSPNVKAFRVLQRIKSMRTYQRHGGCEAFGLVSPKRFRYALLLGISIFVAS
jgi:hypothetical protein